MPVPKILVAEDDAHTRTLMRAVLKQAGFEADAACDGQQALDMLDRGRYDLLVTDIMMPRLSGLELVEQLREAGIQMPVLMVTAKGEPVDRRRGFIVGTDDYLVKPIDAQEMVLRVRALLRRSQIAFERRLRIGEVELNYDALTVSRPGTSLTLPPKEFYLLFKLLAYPDQIFTRAQLMEEVWESRYVDDASTVNVHVNRLRKRFAGWPEFEIVTVRGIGYKAVRHDG